MGAQRACTSSLARRRRRAGCSSEPGHERVEEGAVAVVLDHRGELEHGLVRRGRGLGRGEARRVDDVGPADELGERAHVDAEPRSRATSAMSLAQEPYVGSQNTWGRLRGCASPAAAARARVALRRGAEAGDVVVEVPGEPLARRVAEVEDGVLVAVEPPLGDRLHPRAVAARLVAERRRLAARRGSRGW